MSDVISHSEKICEPDYYSEALVNPDFSNLYEIPSQNNMLISPVSDCITSHYSSFCSSGFSDMDTTTTFASLPLSYNNSSFGNWSYSSDSTQQNFNNYGYSNYNQEVENNCGIYSNYYNQGYTQNNTSVTNCNDVPLTYIPDPCEDRSQMMLYQSTEFDPSQIMEGNCNQTIEYPSQDQQFEEISNYDQMYNTSCYQVVEKAPIHDTTYDTKKQSYNYFYTPELLEVIEFFRSNKEAVIGKSLLQFDTAYNCNNDYINSSSISNVLIDIQEEFENDSMKSQRLCYEEQPEMKESSLYSEKSTDSSSTVYEKDPSQGYQNEMIVENIEVFATNFKNQRISFGFTQGDVGRHIGLRFGTEFSQTTISRFEALNLSCKNMLKLKPKLEEWLASTQQLFQQGYTTLEINEHNLHNRFPRPSVAEQEAKEMAEIKKVKRQYTNDNTKKRRKRTNLVPEQRNVLFKKYLENKRPPEEVLKKLAREIGLDISVVKIWFCNRRQKDRKTYVKVEQ